MIAFGADVTRYGRSLFVWVEIYGCEGNSTWPVAAPRRFLRRSKAERWARGQVLELEHREAQVEFHRQMAALTNGVAA